MGAEEKPKTRRTRSGNVPPRAGAARPSSGRGNRERAARRGRFREDVQSAHGEALSDLRARPTLPQPPIWARPTPFAAGATAA